MFRKNNLFPARIQIYQRVRLKIVEIITYRVLLIFPEIQNFRTNTTLLATLSHTLTVVALARLWTSFTLKICIITNRNSITTAPNVYVTDLDR